MVFQYYNFFELYILPSFFQIFLRITRTSAYDFAFMLKLEILVANYALASAL